MRTMKDSGIEWIGEIPESWDVIKLSYLFDTIGSGTTPNSSNGEFYDGEYSWLQTGDLTDGYITTTSKTITQEAVDSCSALTLFKRGAVVIAMYGATIGKLGILDIDCYTNQACCALSDPVNTNSKFIYYWLLCNKENIVRLSLGGGQPNISQGIITGLKVSIPTSISEQNLIVEYLDKKCAEIDALIAAKEKTNALLREHRQSIIYEAVTKGLNPDIPMKASGVERIGMIPETWRVAPLRRFATIRSGLTLGKRYPDGTKLVEYPYLRVANVQGEYTDLTDVATVQVTENEAKLYALHAGELLMTEGGDRDKLGRGCVWEGEISPCLHQNHVFALSTNEDLNIYYVDYLTTSDVGRSYFDFTAKKTTNLASTNASTIMAFPIPVPPRDEQDAIVSYLREKCAEIDRLIIANERTISKLKEYRQSVIYEAVTGKIEI